MHHEVQEQVGFFFTSTYLKRMGVMTGHTFRIKRLLFEVLQVSGIDFMCWGNPKASCCGILGADRRKSWRTSQSYNVQPRLSIVLVDLYVYVYICMYKYIYIYIYSTLLGNFCGPILLRAPQVSSIACPSKRTLGLLPAAAEAWGSHSCWRLRRRCGRFVYSSWMRCVAFWERLKCGKGQNGGINWFDMISLCASSSESIGFVAIVHSTSTIVICYTDYTVSFLLNGIVWPRLRRIESRNCTTHATKNLLSWCHPG